MFWVQLKAICSKESAWASVFTLSAKCRYLYIGPEDMGSLPGRVIPKTLKVVLDTSLLNTQQYEVRIKGKVEQSRERSCALHYTALS